MKMSVFDPKGKTVVDERAIPAVATDGGKRLARVVEMYYTAADLAALWRCSEWKVRELAKQEEFTVRDAQGNIQAQPMELAGELRIPASAVNAYAARHTYHYTEGIKARNRGELQRKLGTKKAAFSLAETIH